MTTTVQVTPNHRETLVCEAIHQHYDSTGMVRSETTAEVPLGKTSTFHVHDAMQLTIRERIVDLGAAEPAAPEAGMNAEPVTFSAALEALVTQAIAAGDDMGGIVEALELHRKRAVELID